MKKPLETPTTKGLKISSDKSSRKAFGNVSNVLHSGSQHPIGAKKPDKMKNTLKESDESIQKSDQNKPMATEVENDSKFFDENRRHASN